MKRIAISLIAIAILAMTNALPAQTPAVPSPQAGAVQATPGMVVKRELVQMDEQLKKMQAQHARMMAATTPEERQKWMDEQHKSMQEGMAMLTRMMQESRMRGRITAQQTNAADADELMHMMMKGIEMMQLMTQMMMDQLGLTRDAGGMGAAPKE